MSHSEVAFEGHHTPVMEPSPFAIPAKKLAMWLFIISDIMTFAACLVAYGFLRNATANWPRPFHSGTIIGVVIMTFILVTSSLIMTLAVRAARAGDRAGAYRMTMVTLVLGILFVLLHIREWFSMIGQGVARSCATASPPSSSSSRSPRRASWSGWTKRAPHSSGSRSWAFGS